MTKLFLLGAAASALFVGQATALTMTPTSDGRLISAEAQAGFDSDSDSKSPGPGFPAVSGEVSANAMEQLVFEPVEALVTDNFPYGASASASAGQNSQVGALSITGNGYAEAGGYHGEQFPALNTLQGEDGNGFGHYSATGQSLLEVYFYIDEPAWVELNGFLFAGNVEDEDGFGGDSENSAKIILINTDTNTSTYKAKVSDDSLIVDESGLIGPGNYMFSVEAYASVYGGEFDTLLASEPGDLDVFPGYGTSTGASYEKVSLRLSATDQPIPEPVTTTLTAMGLLALTLRTSRRRA